MNEFLANILRGIDSVIGNYGWSMVVFTVLIKLLLSPLDFKSRKSMRRMSQLQPQTAKLQKKYANDKEKLNQKTAELYKKEKVNPLSGCLPMLLSMPILFIMFAAMRIVANEALAEQALGLLTTGTQTNEGWLWVKNLWMPDSPFSAVIADQNSLLAIPADVWAKAVAAISGNPEQMAALAELGIDTTAITGETVYAALKTIGSYTQELAPWPTMPTLNLLITQITIYANWNGLFILPILAAVTQFLMSATQPTTTPDANSQQNSTNKIMKYFFPLFSLWICSSYNTAFTIYWVTSNLFAWAEGLIMNKILEAREKLPQVSEGEESVK